VVHQVHFAHADTRKIERLVNCQRISAFPLTIFEIAATGGYLADIDFRIKISSKCFTVIAAVAVNNVNRMNFVE